MKLPSINRRIAGIWAAAFVIAASAGAGIATSVAGNANTSTRNASGQTQVIPPVVGPGVDHVQQSAAHLEQNVIQAMGAQSYVQSVVVALRHDAAQYLGVDAPTFAGLAPNQAVWIIKAHGLVRGSTSTKLGDPAPDAEHDVYYMFDDATGQVDAFGLLDIQR